MKKEATHVGSVKKMVHVQYLYENLVVNIKIRLFNNNNVGCLIGFM